MWPLLFSNRIIISKVNNSPGGFTNNNDYKTFGHSFITNMEIFRNGSLDAKISA